MHGQKKVFCGVEAMKGNYSKDGGQLDELKLLVLKSKVVERGEACVVEKEIPWLKVVEL
jgi:hypothetical protein